MPDFGALGIAAVVCVVLWLWKEDYRRREDIYRERTFQAEDQSDRAVKLLSEMMELTEQMFRKLMP